MKNFKIGEDWIDKIIPEGLLIFTSTIFSGEGGSGKPLLGFSIINSWLKQGGNVIYVLTSTGKIFVENALKRIYNFDLERYQHKIKYIEFSPTLAPTVDAIEETGETIKANLLNPEVWEKAINMANERLEQASELGTLVFASAINLFLFSKTYGGKILKKMEEIVKQDKTKTYLFTVSTTAYKEKIKILEDAADNLFFTRMEQPMKLFLKISRAKDVDFSEEEVEVPLKTEDLKIIKNLSEQSRVDLIPIISRI